MLNFKVLISGEGGQGVQTIAKILQRAAFNKNKETLCVPNFGVEQRGGISIAFLQISESKICYPKFQRADLAVILSARAADRIASFINKDTQVLFNSSLIEKFNIPCKKARGVDAANIAIIQFSPRVLNMIILKEMLNYFDFLDRDDIIRGMEEELGDKFVNNEKLREDNIRIFKEIEKLRN